MGKANIKFALNFAAPCNFDYARAQGYTPEVAEFSTEELARYADYIKFILKRHLYEDRRVVLNVHGDDMLTQLGSFIDFSARLNAIVDYFSIQTNAVGLQRNKALLLTLWKMLGQRLAVDICCDFAGSDDHVDAARYNLRWLFARGMGAHCVVQLTPANIDSILDTFEEVRLLRCKYPQFVCELSVDYTSQETVDFDESAIATLLETIRHELRVHPALEGAFVYCPSLAARTAPCGNPTIHYPLVSMTDGGVIYPCYDVPFMTDNARDSYSIGSVFEDFELLEARRAGVLNQCKDFGTAQGNLCCSVPWDPVGGMLSLQPTYQHCVMHRLLTEYLPFRSNFYRTID